MNNPLYTDPARWLSVPTEPEWCWIPLGMPESDFALLEATLVLWRERIVKLPAQNVPLTPVDGSPLGVSASGAADQLGKSVPLVSNQEKGEE